MNKPRLTSSFAVSGILHGLILTLLAIFRFQLLGEDPEFVLETIFAEDRTQQEFSQELEMSSEVSETQNIVTGGGYASTLISRAAGPTVAQQKIDTSESLKQPVLKVNPGEMTLPGEGEIDRDLGEGLIEGGVDVVNGYGPALGRITQELIRLMHLSRVHVVWLFDESHSMKDDQTEIRQKFHKVYQELEAQQQQGKKSRRDREILWTSIVSFGETVHKQTSKPTSDINLIRTSIDRISIDESGQENTCLALVRTLDEFGPQSVRTKRKLLIILVSDESGDDGGQVEEVIERAKRFKAPIYILGRESIFGYPYARMRWKDPKYGLNHWLRIKRGPETAHPECLQWNGFRARWDVYSSGFGPYEQVRIAKESGGIFFLLPGKEQNLAGPGAWEKRRFNFLDMKEYEPLLESRRLYQQKRKQSKFRQQIWNVIQRLNPHLDNQLNIEWYHYSMDPFRFREQSKTEFSKGVRAMMLANEGLGLLDAVQPLRAQEGSQRWRAGYDLIVAQLLSYRVRLFQYLLAMDKHAAENPKPQTPKSNEWRIARSQQRLEPDDAQFERVRKAYKLKINREEFIHELKQQQQRSRELYQMVIKEHPATPWARRAARELSWGFGITFRDYFYDPRYYGSSIEIKFPKP